MPLRDDHLRALLACVDEGTFDGAAAALGVTPSAISQRIKALEHGVGQLVLVRSVPVQPTGVGQVLVRAARARVHLDHDLARDLARAGIGSDEVDEAPLIDLPIAVNADSLATWFIDVMAEAASWPSVRLRLFIEDQDHSQRLLRDGSVVGAVTASSEAVQGCSVIPLGVMTYLPLVSEQLWQRCGASLAATPSVRFNANDDLQRRLMRERGLGVPLVEHVVPSAQGFVDAIEAGLGWGMVPSDLAVGRSGLMRVPGLDDLDVPLFWQRWRLETEALDRLTDQVAASSASMRVN